MFSLVLISCTLLTWDLLVLVLAAGVCVHRGFRIRADAGLHHGR